MSPEKSYVAAVTDALRQAGVKGAECRTSTTAERMTIELLTPEGVFSTTTVRMRAVPASDAGQLALPMFGEKAPVAQVLADGSPGAPEDDHDGLVELVAPEGWEPTALEEVLDAKTAIVWTWADKEESALRTVVPASMVAPLQAHLDEHAALPVPLTRRAPTAPSHLLLVGDELATQNGGPQELLGFVGGDFPTAGAVLFDGCWQVAWFDTVTVEGDELVFRPNQRWLVDEPTKGSDGLWTAKLAPAPDAKKTAKARPAKKSAPGSKKKPHRMTAIPEADALAQFGALVAVALQPDTHWKLYASNPEKAGGPLLTSPEWKKRWHRAEQSDLRVRLYNRARRCTHDSLDGPVGEGGSDG